MTCALEEENVCFIIGYSFISFLEEGDSSISGIEMWLFNGIRMRMLGSFGPLVYDLGM